VSPKCSQLVGARRSVQHPHSRGTDQGRGLPGRQSSNILDFSCLSLRIPSSENVNNIGTVGEGSSTVLGIISPCIIAIIHIPKCSAHHRASRCELIIQQGPGSMDVIGALLAASSTRHFVSRSSSEEPLRGTARRSSHDNHVANPARVYLGYLNHGRRS
jgi:hypothetical protein